MQNLPKNTARQIGIISCSLLVLLLISITGTGRAADRTYEIQFHDTKLHKKLDYNRLYNIGVQKIIYRVYQDDENHGGLFFDNTQFKTLSPGLQDMLDEPGRKKLDFCAWMITRTFKWIDDPKLLDYQYKNGELRTVRKLDLFNPAVMQKLIGVFRELASHRIDCILIQDDLTIRHNEGFSQWGKAKFRQTTQVPPREAQMMKKNSPFYLNWQRIKMNQLKSILKTLVQACKRVNSGIKIGINIYYETPVFEKRSEAWYGHNLREILDTGVDYIYLMSYHRQIKSELKHSEDRNRVFFKELVEKAWTICRDKLIVKIQVKDYQTGEQIPAEEVKLYLNLVPRQVKRICFTPLTPDDYDYLEDIIGAAKNAKRHD